MTPQVYHIPSRTTPETPHIVVVDPDHLTARCDCKGYLYRGHCSHVTAALAKPAPAPVAKPRAPYMEELDIIRQKLAVAA
jgi:uncharacterized Zn finger protein